MHRFLPYLIPALLLLAQSLAAQDVISNTRILAEGGYVNPMGDLPLKVDGSYYGNLGLAYPFAGPLDGYMQGGYAYLPVESEYFAGLHQLNGRAGIEYSATWLGPLSIGGGISLIFVRGDSIAPEAKDYFLYDNESEFGWHARLTMPVLQTAKCKFGLRAWWEEIWTQPEASQFLWLGMYAEVDP